MTKAGRKERSLFSPWFPEEVFASAYDIDYAALREQGIRGLIFDIDNTLVPHGFPADDRSRELFAKFRGLGMSACLISNNREPRVRPFAEEVGASFVSKAGKPSGRSYRTACERMGTEPAETVMIGDQLFTDIWGANRAGIRAFLVEPIDPKEEFQIVLKRIPERWVMAAWRRRKVLK